MSINFDWGKAFCCCVGGNSVHDYYTENDYVSNASLPFEKYNESVISTQGSNYSKGKCFDISDSESTQDYQNDDSFDTKSFVSLESELEDDIITQDSADLDDYWMSYFNNKFSTKHLCSESLLEQTKFNPLMSMTDEPDSCEELMNEFGTGITRSIPVMLGINKTKESFEGQPLLEPIMSITLSNEQIQLLTGVSSQKNDEKVKILQEASNGMAGVNSDTHNDLALSSTSYLKKNCHATWPESYGIKNNICTETVPLIPIHNTLSRLRGSMDSIITNQTETILSLTRLVTGRHFSTLT